MVSNQYVATSGYDFRYLESIMNILLVVKAEIGIFQGIWPKFDQNLNLDMFKDNFMELKMFI